MADTWLESGWYWPQTARKAHYFIEGTIVPLCGRRLRLGMRAEKPNGEFTECAPCRRVLDRDES